jgi:RNA-binding protein YhbY
MPQGGCMDDVIDERVDNLEKDMCEALKITTASHDQLIRHDIELEHLIVAQESVNRQLGGMDTKLDGIGNRLEKVELNTATQEYEQRSFMADHLNTILGSIVVGLVGTVLIIFYYAVVR